MPKERSRAPEPQQARAIATRQGLIDATIASIEELGYARTTTTEICKRAGVSQGALFKHFPSKAELLGAATEELFEGLVQGYRNTFISIIDHPDRLGAALELLWGVFTDAPLQVAFELYVAARTDAELRATLQPVLMEHRQNLRNEAAFFFPEAADSSEFDSTIDGIMAAMQGAALTGMVLPQPESSQGELSFIDRAARADFARAIGLLAAQRKRSATVGPVEGVS
ncbi:MAG: TetR/AcrR family transcriptional regulator [Myxococcales bacterium]|nr:TetR/AcrR family transcriptional regulator [Myxococcales bacterium]